MSVAQLAPRPLHEIAEDRRTIDLARQCVFQFLSLAVADPRSRRWNRFLSQPLREMAIDAADLLREELSGTIVPLAPGELPPDLLDLRRIWQLVDSREAINEQYEGIFGLMMSKKCPPYESEYCRQTFSVYRSQQIADVAGFYSAFGLQPSGDAPERHDHLSLELEFMAYLIGKTRRAAEAGDERAAICREAQVAFFKEHLAWWVTAFACALRRQEEGRGQAELAHPPESFYGAVAYCLAAFIAVERAILGIDPPTELVPASETEDTHPADADQCAGCQ